MILGIASSLGLPIRFIGVGESVEDLRMFDAAEFVDALLEGVRLGGYCVAVFHDSTDRRPQALPQYGRCASRRQPQH